MSPKYRIRRQTEHLKPGVVRNTAVGMASLLTLYSPATTPMKSNSASSIKSLRGDMVRLGCDMRVAIGREKKNEKTAS